MDEEKKVVHSFVVSQYEDGTVDVKDAGVEGTETLSNDQIFTKIEDYAKLISLRRASDVAFAAAYNAVAKFYQDAAAAQRKAAEVNPDESKS